MIENDSCHSAALSYYGFNVMETNSDIANDIRALARRLIGMDLPQSLFELYIRPHLIQELNLRNPGVFKPVEKIFVDDLLGHGLLHVATESAGISEWFVKYDAKPDPEVWAVTEVPAGWDIRDRNILDRIRVECPSFSHLVFCHLGAASFRNNLCVRHLEGDPGYRLADSGFILHEPIGIVASPYDGKKIEVHERHWVAKGIFISQDLTCDLPITDIYLTGSDNRIAQFLLSGILPVDSIRILGNWSGRIPANLCRTLENGGLYVPRQNRLVEGLLELIPWRKLPTYAIAGLAPKVRRERR